MGADVKRVFTIVTGKLPNGKSTPFTIEDIDRLESIMAMRPDIRFISIDPIASFLGRVDENKNAELRGLLGPLSDFADKYNVSILAITHFGKNPSTKATARILGSVAYSNAARVTGCVVADPENDDRRLMLRVKNNLSPNKSGMAYTLQGGVVTWEPKPINQKVTEVLESGNAKPAEKKQGKLDDFLRDLLIPGPMPSSDLIEKARAAGFGKDAVWKAKARLEIRAMKSSMDGGWMWAWTLPIPEASEASEGPEPSEASTKSSSVGNTGDPCDETAVGVIPFAYDPRESTEPPF
jgi:putative DNA primase/helicase